MPVSEAYLEDAATKILGPEAVKKVLCDLIKRIVALESRLTLAERDINAGERMEHHHDDGIERQIEELQEEMANHRHSYDGGLRT